MGAGVYIVRFKRALQCRVGRSLKARTSLRVETGACFLALEHAKDIRAPIIILTDSANHLSEIDDWVGPGRFPTGYSSKDGDILRGVIDLLHYRINLGFPTFSRLPIPQSSPPSPMGLGRLPKLPRLSRERLGRLPNLPRLSRERESREQCSSLLSLLIFWVFRFSSYLADPTDSCCLRKHTDTPGTRRLLVYRK